MLLALSGTIYVAAPGCRPRGAAGAVIGRKRGASATSPYFAIEVVDAQTGRGVPLVELKTTSDVRYYTDSNGLYTVKGDKITREQFFYDGDH